MLRKTFLDFDDDSDSSFVSDENADINISDGHPTRQAARGSESRTEDNIADNSIADNNISRPLTALAIAEQTLTVVGAQESAAHETHAAVARQIRFSALCTSTRAAHITATRVRTDGSPTDDATQSMRHHPAMAAEIQAWWQAAMQQRTTSQSRTALSRHEFTALWKLIAMELQLEGYDEEQATASAAATWLREAGSSRRMCREPFCRAVLSVALAQVPCQVPGKAGMTRTNGSLLYRRVMPCGVAHSPANGSRHAFRGEAARARHAVSCASFLKRLRVRILETAPVRVSDGAELGSNPERTQSEHRASLETLAHE